MENQETARESNQDVVGIDVGAEVVIVLSELRKNVNVT